MTPRNVEFPPASTRSSAPCACAGASCSRRRPRIRSTSSCIDIDPAPDGRHGDADHGLYTEQGLERARFRQAPGGVLGAWSYAESSPVSRALENVFEDVRVEPVTCFNDLVGEERTDWQFLGRRPAG